MNNIKDSYCSIAAPSEGLYKELGSRFISLAFPVSSADEVKVLVDNARKEYHDARHCCYAYRLGLSGELYRAVDDGEPSSTAGKPILSAIDSKGLSDVLVIVVRYFGGTKLGIPGLTRAYRTAAADALDKAAKEEKTAGREYRLDFPYSSMHDVMKCLNELGITRKSMESGLRCSVTVRVKLSIVGVFEERMSHISDSFIKSF